MAEAEAEAEEEEELAKQCDNCGVTSLVQYEDELCPECGICDSCGMETLRGEDHDEGCYLA